MYKGINNKGNLNLKDIKLAQTNVKNSPSQQLIACNKLVVVIRGVS